MSVLFAERIKYDEEINLKLAKENRTTFKDLKDREITKRSLITPLVFRLESIRVLERLILILNLNLTQIETLLLKGL